MKRIPEVYEAGNNVFTVIPGHENHRHSGTLQEAL